MRRSDPGADDVGRAEDLDLVPLAVQEVELARTRPLRGVQRAAHRLELALHGRVDGARGIEEFGDGPTEHLVARPAEQHLGLAVPLGEVAPRVGLDEGVARHVEHMLDPRPQHGSPRARHLVRHWRPVEMSTICFRTRSPVVSSVVRTLRIRARSRRCGGRRPGLRLEAAGPSASS